jgi:hypothetical protein
VEAEAHPQERALVSSATVEQVARALRLAVLAAKETSLVPLVVLAIHRQSLGPPWCVAVVVAVHVLVQAVLAVAVRAVHKTKPVLLAPRTRVAAVVVATQ